MSARSSVLIAGVVFALAAGSLAGCSGGGGLPGAASGGAASGGSASGGSGSGSGSGGSSTTGHSSAPSGVTASSFSLPKSCPSATEVASTLGESAYGPTVSADSTSLVCSYETATEDGPIISIMPASGLNATNFKAEMLKTSTSATSVKPVSGVGDAAFLVTVKNGLAISVLAGSFAIVIAGVSANGPQLTAMAKKLLAG